MACRSDRYKSGIGRSATPKVATSNPGPEMTTITNNSIALRELLEKSANTDLLREMMTFAAELVFSRRVGPGGR